MFTQLPEKKQNGNKKLMFVIASERLTYTYSSFICSYKCSFIFS